MNVASCKINRVFPDGRSEEQEMLLLKEHRLLINVNGKNFCSLVCTEENLLELVAGHLLSSGLIESKSEIDDIRFCETKSRANVLLSSELDFVPLVKKEESCCSGNEIFFRNADLSSLKKLPSVDVKNEWIFNLAKTFSEDSAIHKHTSGTHSCILARKEKVLFSCEDIGRHTALDKALGFMLLNEIPAEEVLLFTSGRVPVDMVEKVIRAKVGILVSKSVPTEQSVRLAEQYGLKLFFRAWQDSFETALSPCSKSLSEEIR